MTTAVAAPAVRLAGTWPARPHSILPLAPTVYADAAGNLLVGRDAVHSARLDPARFEPNPKRRVDDGLRGERRGV